MAIGDISVGIYRRGDKASEGEMADGHFGSSSRSAPTPRRSVRAFDRRPTTASRLLISGWVKVKEQQEEDIHYKW